MSSLSLLPPDGLLDGRFGSANFTNCLDSALINVTQVTRQYDRHTSTFQLLMEGNVPGITYPPVESYAVETFALDIGFSPIVYHHQFTCENCIQHGAIQLEKNFSTVHISFPLVDIGARYEMVMDGTTPVVCVDVAPVGYVNGDWRKVFKYMPLSVVAVAAMATLLAIVAATLDGGGGGSGSHDIFVALMACQASGITMDDVVVYAQFVFATGALNLAYPRFYALFTANFAWSWLLFSPRWLHRLLDPHAAGAGVAASASLTHLAHAMDMDVRALFLPCIVFYGCCLAVLVLVGLALWVGYGVLAVLDPYRFGGHRRKLGSVCIGILVRLTTLVYLPLTALSFYQLMLPGPWYLTLVASFVLAGIVFGKYSRMAILIVQRHSSSSDPNFVLRYGQLYAPLRESTFYFCIVVLVHRLLVGAMVGLFQMSGEAQAGVLLAMDVGMLALHATLSPYADRVANGLAVLTAAVRSIVDALNVLFLVPSALTDRQRQYVAYAQVVLHFVVFAVLLGTHLSRLLALLLGGSRRCMPQPPSP